MAAVSPQVAALPALERALAPHGLRVMGCSTAAEPVPGNGAPPLVLIGAGPAMWPRFRASPEHRDGAPHPLDRWSKRVIDPVARKFDATALYPSDGPPYAPFTAWALGSGRFWQSPVGMLVHDEAGLMISLRGALSFHRPAPLSPAAEAAAPCHACAAPCKSACPVDALQGDRYDVDACKAHVRSPAGRDCLMRGCAARRACPVSQSFGRVDAQSEFHMRAFICAN